jgi:hypothetical protein
MITIKTTAYYNWIASVKVSLDKIPDSQMAFIHNQLVISPFAGKDVVRVSFFGPRGARKDTATFSRAQAKELSTALLLLAEDIE